MVSDFVLGSYVLSFKPKTKSNPDEKEEIDNKLSMRTPLGPKEESGHRSRG